MTFDEVHALPDPTVVLCADNKAGLLIGWPREGHEDEPRIVQIPGDEESRRIHHTKLHLHGHAVVEDGACLVSYLLNGGK